jgi:hypothetical protein
MTIPATHNKISSDTHTKLCECSNHRYMFYWFKTKAKASDIVHQCSYQCKTTEWLLDYILYSVIWIYNGETVCLCHYAHFTPKLLNRFQWNMGGGNSDPYQPTIITTLHEP